LGEGDNVSETDDIFDIDTFLTENKAPAYIKRAWNNHLNYFNRCEEAAENGYKVIGALRSLKVAIERIK
jgi:hypothetical protein